MSQLYAKKKIGILTLPITHNYGGILQCVALQKILEDFGYTVIVFNRVAAVPKWKRVIKTIVFGHYVAKIERFKKQRLEHLTHPIQSSKELQAEITSSGVYFVVVGSDQIWREQYATDNFSDCFLTFLKDSYIKKLAYAASFGKAAINTPAASAEISLALQSFAGVSVRERSGITILKDVFNIENAVITLDPTLLLHADFYSNLMNGKQKFSMKKILLAYVLDENKSRDNEINRIAKAQKLSVVKIKHQPHNLLQRMFQQKKSVEEWLQLFNQAEFIITDSYHGMLFSIIFKKQFVALINEKRGATRFESIAQQLGLESRLYTNLNRFNEDVIANNNINYDRVYKQLNTLKTQSLAFLTQHLKHD